MSAEVVGTAYVRIRALTKQFAKDLKDGLDKSVNDAKVEDTGKDMGTDLGEGLVEGFTETVTPGIDAGIEEAFNDTDDKPAEKHGERTGDSWFSSFSKRLKSILAPRFGDIFKQSSSSRQRTIGDAGDGDGDVFADGFFTRIRRRFSGGGGDNGGIFSGLLGGLGGALSGATKMLSEVFGGGDDGGKLGFLKGKGMGGGFIKGFKGPLLSLGAMIPKLLFNPVAMISAAVVAIGPGIIQALTGAVAMVGPIMTGLVGGGLAAVTAGIAGLAALGPIIAAFKVETPMLELFQEEMKGITERMKEVAEVAQKEVLPGVLNLADTFVTVMNPSLIKFSSYVGDAFGDFTDGLAKSLRAGPMANNLSLSMMSFGRGFRTFMEALNPFIVSITTGLAALSKLAPVVAKDMASLFSGFSTGIAERGIDGLTDRFTYFYDTFKTVMTGLKDFSFSIFNILAVGSEATDGFFQRFSDWAAKFREWTASVEGKSSIWTMFDNALPAMKETFGLLSDVIKLIFTMTTDSDSEESGFVKTIRWLRQEGLPWLVDSGIPGVKAGFESLKDIIGKVWETIKPFVDTIKDVFGPAIQEGFGYLQDRGPSILDKLAGALEKLEKPFDQVGKALGDGLGAFFTVLGKWAESGVLDLLIGSLVILLQVFADIVSIPGFAELIGYLAGFVVILMSVAKVAGIVIGALSAIGSVVATIAGVIGVTIAAPAAVIGAVVVAIVGLIYILFKNWDKVGAFFTETLPNIFSKFVNWVRETFIPRFLDGLSKIWEFMKELPGKLWGFLKEAIKKFGEFGKLALSKLIGFGGKVIGAILGGIWAVIKALPGLIGNVIKFFALLPVRILAALLGLGARLLALIVVVFAGIFIWLKDTGIPKTVEFFKGLPDKIKTVLVNLKDFLKEKFVEAFDTVKTFIQEKGGELVGWFKELPGKIKDAITDFVTSFPEKFREGMDAAKARIIEGITSIKDAISSFVTDTIPNLAERAWEGMKNFGSRMWEGLTGAFSSAGSFLQEQIGNVKDAVIGGLKSFLNNIMEKIEDALTFSIGGWGPFPKLSFDPSLPRFAVGGIFDRATAGIMGEAGREVLLPLTNPKRTLELAMQSGLFGVLSAALRLSQSAPVMAMGGGMGGAIPTLSGGGRQTVFESGAIQVVEAGASAPEVANLVVSKIDWKLSSRNDR